MGNLINPSSRFKAEHSSFKNPIKIPALLTAFVIGLSLFQNVAIASTPINQVTTLRNATLRALLEPEQCRAAFSGVSANILRGRGNVVLDTFKLAPDLDLSKNSSVPSLGYTVSQVSLQSLQPMVSLDRTESIKATLVFSGTRRNGSQITFRIGEFKFDFASNKAFVGCQPRGYVVFGLKNVLEARAAIEISRSREAIFDYNRIVADAIDRSKKPSFAIEVPARGNIGWAVMDRIYSYGTTHLLKQHSELVTGELLTRVDDYSARVREELLTVANGSSAANTPRDVNFQDWSQKGLLENAQIALGVAAGLDWYRESLSPDERLQIRAALIRKSFNIFYGNFQSERGDKPTTFAGPYNAWWIRSRSNWNLVNNGSMLVMLKVLAFEVNPRSEPELATQIQNLFHWITREWKSGEPSSLSFGIHMLSNGDGGSYEGPNYWNYAMLNFAAIMGSYSLSEVNLGTVLSREHFLAAARFALAMRNSNAIQFNYSDTGERASSYPPVYMLGRLSQNAQVTLAELRLQRIVTALDSRVSLEDALDLFWRRDEDLRTNPSSTLLPQVAIFPNTSVGRVSETSSQSNMYLGFKGGTSDSQHRQSENGSFVFDANGVRFASDLGPDSYSLPNYGAWSIYYRQRAEGNNCLSVNGELQTNRANSTIGFSESDGIVNTWTNLQTAYQNSTGIFGRNLRNYFRHFFTNTRPGQAQLTVQDEFTLAPTSETLPIVTWNMHTQSNVVIEASKAPQAQNRLILQHSSGKRISVVVDLQNAKLVSMELVSPPAMNSPGLTIRGVTYLQGSGPLRSDMKVLRIRVQPNNMGQPNVIRVNLTPANSALY